MPSTWDVWVIIHPIAQKEKILSNFDTRTGFGALAIR